MLDERYKADTLFLLIGKNTLPNYVAARLLLRSSTASRLVLVYSQATASQRQKLEDILAGEGFQQFTNVQVEESSPIDIENKVGAQAQGLQGRVGLNYTGGTKAMAVHAYRVLDQKLPDVQFSYLDARTLSLVLAHEKVPHPVGTEVPVSLKVLLGLHSRALAFKPDPLWPQTAHAIAHLHASDDSRKAWHTWIAKTFFKEPQWPVFQAQILPAEMVDDDEQWKQWVRELCVWQTYKQRVWDEESKRSKRIDIPTAFQQVRNAFSAETNFADAPLLSDVIEQTLSQHVDRAPQKSVASAKRSRKLKIWANGLKEYSLSRTSCTRRNNFSSRDDTPSPT